MKLIVHKDEYLNKQVPVVSYKITSGELTEHVYSLPDGSLVQEGFGYDVVKPDKNAWNKFIKAMESLTPKEHIWQNLYILDGTSWHFFYEHKSHKIEYKVANEWPENYAKIIKALKRLSNFK
jgi:hypothetical protein